MRLPPIFLALILSIAAPAAASDEADGFHFHLDEDAGEMRLTEGDTPVLSYVFRDRVPDGVDGQYVRSCYIHPLFDLDGRPLTEDFPEDHPHHRGLGWVWPRVKVGEGVGERQAQTWHPSPLRQHFVRWSTMEATDDQARLGIEVEWRMEDEVVATEEAEIIAYPVADGGRAIDFHITVTAGDEPVELLGAEEKGYGGFVLRAAADFKGAQARTDKGKLTEDAVGEQFRWADLSTDERGVAFFTPPGHPDAPPTWMVRTSYAGILNVAWPGVKPFVLDPGESIELAYRVWVHGEATAEEVEGAYGRYVEEDSTAATPKPGGVED